jgi:hypothetical protein
VTPGAALYVTPAHAQQKSVTHDWHGHGASTHYLSMYTWKGDCAGARVGARICSQVRCVLPPGGSMDTRCCMMRFAWSREMG